MDLSNISLLCGTAGPVVLKADRAHGLQPPAGSAKASLAAGSLPSSPEAEEHYLQDFSLTCPSALEEETRLLIGDYYRGYTGQEIRNHHPALGTMSRVVDRVVQKHRFAYNGMIKKLGLEHQDDSMDFVRSIAKTLFNDGTTNWGRVASLVAFGAVLCEQLKEMKRGHCIQNVAMNISSYLNVHQQQWLVNNNAWDGFVEFFRENDPESRVRNTLMAVAGVAGLGAGLALLMR